MNQLEDNINLSLDLLNMEIEEVFPIGEPLLILDDSIILENSTQLADLNQTLQLSPELQTLNFIVELLNSSSYKREDAITDIESNGESDSESDDQLEDDSLQFNHF